MKALRVSRRIARSETGAIGVMRTLVRALACARASVVFSFQTTNAENRATVTLQRHPISQVACNAIRTARHLKIVSSANGHIGAKFTPRTTHTVKGSAVAMSGATLSMVADLVKAILKKWTAAKFICQAAT